MPPKTAASKPPSSGAAPKSAATKAPAKPASSAAGSPALAVTATGLASSSGDIDGQGLPNTLSVWT